MIKVAKEWNPKQSRLREIIFNPEKFDEAIKLCLEMHKKVHSSEMSKCSFTTYEDRLWNGLNEELFRVVPLDTNNTIAWNIWHITRIEDIV